MKPRNPDPNEISPLLAIGVAACLFVMLSGLAALWLGGASVLDGEGVDGARVGSVGGDVGEVAKPVDGTGDPRRPVDDGGLRGHYDLQRALKDNNVRAAMVAIDAIPVTVLDQPSGGMTPLMRAASHGERELVERLLARGADPNARGRSRRTALQYAAERDHVAVAEVLLDAGADVNGRDNGHLTPLIMAADRGYTGLGRLLLERGADPNVVHKQGWTALIDAARHGNLPLVDALLRRGADAEARMPDGRSAIDLARHNGHNSVAKRIEGHVAVRNARRAAKMTVAASRAPSIGAQDSSRAAAPGLVGLLVAGSYRVNPDAQMPGITLRVDQNSLLWRDAVGECAVRLAADRRRVEPVAACARGDDLRRVRIEWSEAGAVRRIRGRDGQWYLRDDG